jgi:threonine dehydratase
VESVPDLISIDHVTAAAERIATHVLRTPTVPSPGLADHLGVPVTCKLELLQRTGSFKPRGGINKLLGISAAERETGVATVSGGNHAIALAEAAAALGVAATVVMPETASRRSIAAARARGADVRLTPDVSAAFALLDELVAAGRTLVHPFDDPALIAGHGTVGLELAADAPDVTDVLVSIGGGALISGIATALRALLPGVRVWGVETGGADSMSRALAAGAPVTMTPTSIATTLAPPFVSELTLGHVSALVEDVIVVPDADAVRGCLTFAEEAKIWTEPAAGCLLPAAHQVLDRVGPDVRLGLVVCGGNVTAADVAGWVQRFGATPFPARLPVT